MINSLDLIRNIGRFDSFSTGADFQPLTLIYAENGRGKTTITAMLRSLGSGDPIPIGERRRLAARHPPHAIVTCSGGPPDAMFQNGAWNRTLPDVLIFDDVFVDQNVYSGLVVGSDHRQNLHELILGSQGVDLNRRLQNYIARIEQHNGQLRHLSALIPDSERGGISVDEFCALPRNVNIDAEIQAAEQALAASLQQEPIRNTPDLPTIHVAEVDFQNIESVLRSGVNDLDAAAVARVQAHIEGIGAESERWVSDGMALQAASMEAGGDACVFCAQSLSDSPVIGHYRAFFGEAYRAHQRRILEVEEGLIQALSPDAVLQFERTVRTLQERRNFWAAFGQIGELDFDPAEAVDSWNAVRERFTELLEKKRVSPLDSIILTEEAKESVESFQAMRRSVAEVVGQIADANQTIAEIKQRSATGNSAAIRATLNRLYAVRARHTPATDTLCQNYLDEKGAKSATEEQRDLVRRELDQYRIDVFPAYEAAINRYLVQFSAGYRLSSVQAINTRGGPTCTYEVIVNETPVAVAGGRPQPGEHSFRNVLSAGDRNTLALAFFLASIEQDPNRGGRVVVIDDPVSSLDEHRSLTTVQEIRRLLPQVAQVVVLSHSKAFLCQVWESVTSPQRVALQVVRQGTQSNIVAWDVSADSETENDRRHEMLRQYLANGGNNEREVAEAIRPCLEAFFRVAYPEHFPASKLLGQFRNECDQRLGTPQEILSRADVDELRDIVEYANRFHHDTNPAWRTVTVNGNELESFVQRALDFGRRP